MSPHKENPVCTAKSSCDLKQTQTPLQLTDHAHQQPPQRDSEQGADKPFALDELEF